MDVGGVLVTGVDAHAGRVIARALGGAGWSVALHHARGDAPAGETVEAIRAAGGHGASVQADLDQDDEIASLVAQAAKSIDTPIAALVNAASVIRQDRLDTMTRQSWDRHMHTHLRAPCVLAQAFAAQLPDGTSGAIVNLVDRRARATDSFDPDHFSYALSQAALASATVAMAQALAPRIRVNAVLHRPGSGVGPGAAVADAVLYLLSASAVTGELIAVDGGGRLVRPTPDIHGAHE